jgi:hypothetical protein
MREEASAASLTGRQNHVDEWIDATCFTCGATHSNLAALFYQHGDQNLKTAAILFLHRRHFPSG